MLDADSVFERLLREAANLVPKMSTPKLTHALKVTSNLQQKITETVASRLQNEKDDPHIGSGCVTLRQHLPFNSVIVPTVLHDAVAASVRDSCELRGTAVKQKEETFGTVSPLSDLNHIANSCKESGVVPSSPENAHISLSADSMLPSLPAMTMISTGLDSGRCGAILVPMVPTNHSTSVYQHMSSPVSSSAHLSIVTDPSLSVNSGISMLETTSVNFMSAISNAVQSTTISDCNGRTASTSACSDPTEQRLATEESVDMKPEPLDNVTTTSVEAPLSTVNPSKLASLAFTHLSSLAPFVSQTVTTTVSAVNTAVVVDVGNSASQVVVGGSSPATPEVASSVSRPNQGTGPYRCRDCDKEFRILRYLEKHRRIHTGEKPYQCCYCGRQFNDWPNMNRHKRIHTGERPYRCSVCAKTFSQPAVYNEHVKRHTGERPYICMICAKGFPRAARLAVHMRVHTGERPYPCTACDRRFSQPHHLAAHLRVHSGDRPYSCPKCDVSFACISNLRRHRKQVHPTSPLAYEEADVDGALQRLTSVVPSNEGTTSCQGGPLESTLPAASPSVGGDAPVAIAAAMSGTLLTATGTLVPASLLSASSIPGLILTSGPPSALLTTPGPFTDQQSQLQPTLLAHSSGLMDGTGSAILSTSGSAGVPVSLSHQAGSVSTIASDPLLKSVSSAVSLMLPPVLTASSNPDNLRQTAINFLKPSGELDRSCLTGATLTTTGPDGGLVVSPTGGETVYLEPLDPRLAFESGHQFTLATIPTSHSQGAATILGPSTSGTHLLGHPIQLQTGSHGTHIAFATNLPTPSHLLTPTSSVFSTPTVPQASIYTGQSSSAILFPSPATAPHTPTSGSLTQRLRQQSVHHSQAPTDTSSQLQYHPPNVTSAVEIPPGRPASSPNHHQATLLVPIITSAIPTSGSDSVCNVGTVFTPSWPTGFVAVATTRLSPETSGLEDHNESLTFGGSRPSSVLSNSSSLGAITVTTVNENNL